MCNRFHRHEDKVPKLKLIFTETRFTVFFLSRSYPVKFRDTLNVNIRKRRKSFFSNGFNPAFPLSNKSIVSEFFPKGPKFYLLPGKSIRAEVSENWWFCLLETNSLHYCYTYEKERAGNWPDYPFQPRLKFLPRRRQPSSLSCKRRRISAQMRVPSHRLLSIFRSSTLHRVSQHLKITSQSFKNVWRSACGKMNFDN